MMINKYALVVVLFLLTVFSCSENAKEEVNEPLESAYEIWNDTVVKQKYEDGSIETVWGYRSGDTIMHYEWSYYKNGELWLEGPSDGKLRHGKWKAYNESGVLVAQGSYKMGVAVGIKTVWYGNRKKFYEGEMLDDKRVGVWKFFNKEGTLVKEIDYSKNDTIIH